MLNEATRCLDENIVENAEILDLAMIMGTGFPPFTGDYVNMQMIWFRKYCSRIRGFKPITWKTV